MLAGAGGGGIIDLDEFDRISDAIDALFLLTLDIMTRQVDFELRLGETSTVLARLLDEFGIILQTNSMKIDVDPPGSP